MLEFLSDNGCIDFSKLLLLKGKVLGLSDEEIFVLSLVLMFRGMNVKNITPQLIMNYATLSAKELDQVLCSLLEKNYIRNDAGTISVYHLEERLLEMDEKISMDLSISQRIEKEFGRGLSYGELEMVREWKERGEEDKTILLALNEACKAQALSLKYIDAILRNWAVHGIKTRYSDEKTEERKVPVSNYKWWEDE